MPPAVPPPPPAIHRPAPEVNRANNAENYPTSRQVRVTRNVTPYMGIPFREFMTDAPQPIWYGRSCRGKHTNRLHSRKQAKQRAKRNRR